MPTDTKIDATVEWVMVPREPTEAMMVALETTDCGDADGSCKSIWAPPYRAMIRAAPSPENDALLAAEGEQVALWMIANGYATGHGDTVADMPHRHDEWELAYFRWLSIRPYAATGGAHIVQRRHFRAGYEAALEKGPRP